MKNILAFLAKLPRPVKIGGSIIVCLLLLAILAGLLSGKPKAPAQTAVSPAPIASPTATKPLLQAQPGAPAPTAMQPVTPGPAATPVATTAAPVVTMRPAARLTPEQIASLTPGSVVSVGLYQKGGDTFVTEIEKFQYATVGSKRDSAEFMSIGAAPGGFESYIKGQKTLQIERRGYINIEKAGVYSIVVTAEAEHQEMHCTLYVDDMTLPALSATGRIFTKIATVGLDTGRHDVALRCTVWLAGKFQVSANIKAETDSMPKAVTLEALPEKK